MNIDALSVFFPCINEEGNIENIVEKAEDILKRLKLKYEIIIIDDGSTDSTGKLADRLALTNPNIRAIHHPKNLGYGEALKSGFYNAKYDTIVYTDGDGQFDFAEVTKFLGKIEDNDLVIGYRIKRKDPFFRILFKKGWTLSLWAFFGMTLKDVDCGFKMIKKEALEKIPQLQSSRGAMINAELAIKVKKHGFKIAQIGVNHYPRTSGKPTGASLNVIIKSYLDLLKLWWKLKDQKMLFIVLILVLILASFLRFYRLSEYMTFLGDEGRDAIIVKNILVAHHLPLIGPPTSVGNIYLGPLYYYMMAVPMAIFWLNPAAAAGMNALIGVATIALIYYLGKSWFNRTAGLIAAYLYAISPVTITSSISSWNPNPAPFFSLIAMLGFYKAREERNFGWLVLTGIATAACLQMHYLALILLPIFAMLWLFEIIFKTKPIKNLFSGTIMGILAFALVMSPLVWFDLRHNFLNYHAVTKLLAEGSAVKGDIFLNLLKVPSIYSHDLIGRYLGGENFYLTVVVSVLIILSLFRKSWVSIYLGIWLGIGLLGLSFYQGEIYDHYLGFMNPVPFLLFGSLVSINYKERVRKYVLSGILILIIILTIANFQKGLIKHSPNNQLKKTQDIAKFIINQAGNKPFNFALIAERNYDDAYRFYLDMYGFKPKQVPIDKTDQLFVVCEDLVCDPTHNAKYEVAGFGWSKIDWQKDIYGVKIFRLIPNPSGKP